MSLNLNFWKNHAEVNISENKLIFNKWWAYNILREFRVVVYFQRFVGDRSFEFDRQSSDINQFAEAEIFYGMRQVNEYTLINFLRIGRKQKINNKEFCANTIIFIHLMTLSNQTQLMFAPGYNRTKIHVYSIKVT